MKRVKILNKTRFDLNRDYPEDLLKPIYIFITEAGQEVIDRSMRLYFSLLPAFKPNTVAVHRIQSSRRAEIVQELRNRMSADKSIQKF